MKASKRISPDFLYCFSRQARRSLENKMRLPWDIKQEKRLKYRTVQDQLAKIGKNEFYVSGRVLYRTT